MSRATLPRPQAPVAGNLMPTNEWYRYWSDIALTSDNVPALESTVASLGSRVNALESAAEASGNIQGRGSVSVSGTLSSGVVQIQLQGDVEALPAWHYYGTDSVGEFQTFHEFPENLQQAASLSDVGFILRESDGTWQQRTLNATNGITISDDGNVVTFGGNPYFKATDNGDFPAGAAVVSAESVVAAGAGSNAGHDRSVALGAGTSTDAVDQLAIGPRSIRMNGHTLSATGGGLLYDGSPIGGDSGNSYMPGGW